LTQIIVQPAKPVGLCHRGHRLFHREQLVGRDNVIAGSDCGFGTWVGQVAVDPDVGVGETLRPSPPARNPASNSMAYDAIPYASEQGIYFGLAGN
jgi:hypothetical protein